MAGSKRGFGSMSEEKQREIARKGGQAGHAKGTAHKFTPQEAREAGRKGGEVVSRDRAHMAAIARGARDPNRKANRSASEESRRRAVPSQDTDVHDTETATNLLRADHEKVKRLFQEFQRADEDEIDEKEALAQKAFTELDNHAKVEEEIFYPAVREQAGEVGRDLVDEGLEEHQAVKELIAELRSMTIDDDEYDGKFQDLVDNVLHHAEEEESEMFPLVEEKMSDSLQHLGAGIMERKQQLLSSAQVS